MTLPSETARHAILGIPPDPLKRPEGDMLVQAFEEIEARYRKPQTSLTLHVSKAGNDTTGDGSSGTPFLTPKKAAEKIYLDYDLRGSPATIFIHNSGDFYPGDIQVQGHPTGYHFFYLEGEDEGGVKLQAANGSCATIGDGGILIAKKLQIWGTGAANEFGFLLHQGAIFDGAEGMNYADMTGGVHIGNDGGGMPTINIMNDYIISGDVSEHIRLLAGAVLKQAGETEITFQGAPEMLNLYNLKMAGNNAIFGPTVTWTGSKTITGRAVNIYVGSSIDKGGNTFPVGGSADGGGGDIIL